MLGIGVPPKGPTLRKAASNDVDATTTKREIKRLRKNESGREETQKMKKARDVIGKFFGMNKPTTREILAKLVDEGEHLGIRSVWVTPGKLKSLDLQFAHTSTPKPLWLLCSHHTHCSLYQRHRDVVR